MGLSVSWEVVLFFALGIAQLAGGGFGLTAVINPFSAILTGFLGLPGVALVLLIQNLL